MQILKKTTVTTYRHNIELSGEVCRFPDPVKLETEWTMTFEDGKATEIEIVSCAAFLDERQHEALVDACWRVGDLVENREEYCRQLGIECGSLPDEIETVLQKEQS